MVPYHIHKIETGFLSQVQLLLTNSLNLDKSSNFTSEIQEVYDNYIDPAIENWLRVFVCQSTADALLTIFAQEHWDKHMEKTKKEDSLDKREISPMIFSQKTQKCLLWSHTLQAKEVKKNMSVVK